MKKRVIDADNNKVLEIFDEKDTDKVLEKYKNMSKWNDVGLDKDGDIILWEE